MYPVIKIRGLFQSWYRRSRVKMKSFARATGRGRKFRPQGEGEGGKFFNEAETFCPPLPQDRSSLLSFTKKRLPFARGWKQKKQSFVPFEKFCNKGVTFPRWKCPHRSSLSLLVARSSSFDFLGYRQRCDLNDSSWEGDTFVFKLWILIFELLWSDKLRSIVRILSHGQALNIDFSNISGKYSIERIIESV